LLEALTGLLINTWTAIEEMEDEREGTTELASKVGVDQPRKARKQDKRKKKAQGIKGRAIAQLQAMAMAG
jgi:hypothetical protein